MMVADLCQHQVEEGEEGGVVGLGAVGAAVLDILIEMPVEVAEVR